MERSGSAPAVDPSSRGDTLAGHRADVGRRWRPASLSIRDQRQLYDLIDHTSDPNVLRFDNFEGLELLEESLKAALDKPLSK